MKNLIFASVLFASLVSLSATDRAPQSLTVEYRENPVGVDVAQPRLSWHLPEGVRQQSAYEIEASVRGALGDRPLPIEADGWQSGKVASSDSVNIVWAGKALASSTRVTWRVRVWDEEGNPSAWSEPAAFVTGLMKPSDWQASWIGPRPELRPEEDMKGAKWITGARDKNGTAVLRKSFVFGGAKRGECVEMVHAGYPQHEIYVNGKSCHRYSGHVPRWNFLRFRDITPYLVKGTNTIEVKVYGEKSPDAAFLAKFSLPGGRTMVTDASWQGARELGGVREPAFAQALCLRTETMSPAFQKTFRIDRPVKSAILHVTGVGFYEASLNGRKIGRKVLDPAPTDFDKRVLYSTYDLGAALKAGENTLTILVGHGWYDVRSIATWDFATAPWRNFPRMIAQLEIVDAEGRHSRIVSDGSWREVVSPVKYDCIREGEVVSAADVGKDVGPCAVVPGPKGRLVAENQPGAEVVETMAPEAIQDCGKGTYVVKFPRNFAGWVKATFRGAKKNDVIVIRYDERANANLTPAEDSVTDGLHAKRTDGVEPRRIDVHFRYTASQRVTPVGAAFQADRVIASGAAEETYEPRFTYNGFQYVVLSGLRTAPRREDIVGCVVRTAFREPASFTCSDPTFNTLMTMAKHAYESNFADGYPTDCPHREKNGWTGDASIASELAQYLFENTAAYEKWLQDLCDTQVASGDICCIAPTSGWGFKWGNGPAWDSALPVIAWNLFIYRNDRRILDAVYPTLTRYLAYTATKADGAGLVKHGLGDWIPVNRKHMPATELTSSCYYYQALVIASRMARELGRPDEARKFAATAAHTCAGINAKYYKGNGIYDNGGQTAQAFPIAYGIVPKTEQAKVAAQLVASVERTKEHVDMGLLGTKHVFRALSRIGRTDLAFRMLVNPTAPSMVEWIQKDGTTLWEDWGDGASRNHIMFGDFAGWAYQYLAGIQLPEAEGSCSAIPVVTARAFKRIVFAPAVIDALDHVAATIETPYGRVTSAWARLNGRVRYRFVVPSGTEAVVRLPGRAEQVIGPGETTID